MSIERIYSYYLYTKVPITQRPLARTSINSGFLFYLVTTLSRGEKEAGPTPPG